DLLEPSPRLRGWRPTLGQYPLRESGLAGEDGDVAPGLRETEPREHGNEDPSAQDHREAPLVPRPQAQPEVQTDATVNPGDHEQHRLAEPGPGIHHPEREEHACIGVFRAEERI